MKRGPAGKPGDLQELEGNPGKRRLRGPSPNLGAATAQMPPPSHLSKMAKVFWEENYEPLRRARVLQATDLVLFELLCAGYARWRDAEAQLAEDGARVRTSNGGSGASPFFRIARQAADEVRTLCEQFGLTPPSRARLEVSPAKQQISHLTDATSPHLNRERVEFDGLIGKRGTENSQRKRP